MKTKKILLTLLLVLCFVFVGCTSKEQSPVEFIVEDEISIIEYELNNNNILKNVTVKVNGKEISKTFVNIVLVSKKTEGENTINEYELSVTVKGQKYTKNIEVEVIKSKYTCEVVNIAKAIELCTTVNDYVTEKEYVVKGKIKSIENSNFGSVTIEDETGSISVYGIYGENDVPYDQLVNKPLVGDIVVLQGKLGYFNGTCEMKKSLLLEVEKVEIKPDPTLTLSQIKDVRNMDNNTVVLVEGIVLNITYAEGMVADGFILCDGTDQIYVYGKSVTAGVKAGNKVKIQGEKVQYIADSEKESAAKYGYKGVTQIDRALLIENDNKVNDVKQYTNIYEEKTIKELVENGFDTDITSRLFKVKCIVNKQDGIGFINYYLDDVDGVTGSYTYTKCSGSDFAWLDEFDGKYVEMVVCVINAKSTATGCVYRFLPMYVIKEATFDMNVNDYAHTYVVSDSIETEYPVGATFELPTSFNNEKFGINGNISYSSSDENILTIDGNIVTCHKEGSCNLIVKVDEFEAKEYTVTVYKGEKGATVSTAINANDGDVVTIEGVIASSLVNRDGFYIIDNTGMIAVTVKNKDDLTKIKLGEHVVITGTKSHVKRDSASNIGQSAVINAEIVTNNHGNYPYDTTNIIKGLTIADFNSYSANDDYTTNLYEIKAKVVFEETNFYTTCKLESEDGSKSLSLYCSSATQYEFLKQFNGQVVTMHIALCNWNSKTYYTGCVVSVIDGENIVLNNSKIQ